MPSSAAGAASRRKTASIRASPRRRRVTPPSSARRKWRATSWSARWRRNGRRSWWRFTPSCRAKWRRKRAPLRRASASSARKAGCSSTRAMPTFWRRSGACAPAPGSGARRGASWRRVSRSRRAARCTWSSRGSPSALARRPTPSCTTAAPQRSPERLLHPLTLSGRPEVVGELVDERRHHLFAWIGLGHRAADALLGHVDAPHLPAHPAGVAPHARAARGFHQPRGDVALHLGAQARVQFGEVVHADVGFRIGVGDLAEKHRVDAVFLADALRRVRIDLIAAYRGEHRFAAAEVNEPRPRLRRLDLLLELLGR